ncbi:MAG: hypothetical protein NC393_07790 [Clostridium sp.]|nr:hypothetical protein [Clostridium sp.]MCM1209361.1 hypothetical protein [Ruminococcus sp.]
MNIKMNQNSFFGNMANTGLKSTAEKQERQAKCQSQVDFWEKKKESLKNMECATVEEIAEKLELYHSYEDSIAAAKKAYNNEQMWHIMDEAKERGEKIAEAAKKNEPKTEEERKEELKEEASGGGLLDALGDLSELVEETIEDIQEAKLEQIGEALQDADGQINGQAYMTKDEAITKEQTDMPIKHIDFKV